MDDATIADSDEVKAEEEEEEDEEKKQEEDDDEEEEKKQEEDEEDEEDDEEKQYATLADLEEVVKEVVKGVTEPFATVNESIATIREELVEMRKELNALKQTDDVRVTQKAQETPVASLSAVIARTIVGQQDAELDYNAERKLRKAGPEETESDDFGSGLTGISSIDELIRKQRGGNRVIAAQTNGQ